MCHIMAIFAQKYNKNVNFGIILAIIYKKDIIFVHFLLI